MNRREVFWSVLMCLPALALCTAGTWMLFDRLPKLERGQKSIATREYRSVAVEMIADPLKATEWGPRKKGWRQTSRINGVPWGHLPDGRGERVWCGGDCVGSVVVPFAQVPDVAAWLMAGSLLVMVMSLAITVLGVFFFVRYSKSRDDFLASTVHDLTTPLVALRHFIGRDDEFAGVLVEKMLRLVQNVTDFLRLGHRRAPTCEQFVLRTAYDAAYRIFEMDFAEEKSGPVAVEGPLDIVVSADPLLTTQILWNLLGNALKYAAPHGPVSLTVAAEGGRVSVSLADRGPGLTARQRSHAFDRYYRASTAMVSGKGGFGIGLCTARDFARAMGGDLTVGPNRPCGCVFTLSLRNG